MSLLAYHREGALADRPDASDAMLGATYRTLPDRLLWVVVKQADGSVAWMKVDDSQAIIAALAATNPIHVVREHGETLEKCFFCDAWGGCPHDAECLHRRAVEWIEASKG